MVRPDNQTHDRLTEDDISRMLELYKTRCFKSDNNETDARMWNFWTSFDFASTILSTIGKEMAFIPKQTNDNLQGCSFIKTLYHWSIFAPLSNISSPGYRGMAPRTETGKLFVLVYTIPGMLIMMSYLNIFSTCILIILRKVSSLVE